MYIKLSLESLILLNAYVNPCHILNIDNGKALLDESKLSKKILSKFKGYKAIRL